jgi:hypothetical protein
MKVCILRPPSPPTLHYVPGPVVSTSACAGDEADPTTEEIDNVEKHTAWHTCAASQVVCNWDLQRHYYSVKRRRNHGQTLVAQADDESVDGRAAEPVRGLQAVFAE